MKTEKANEIFGYGFLLVGAFKFILFFLAVMQAFTSIGASLNGANASINNYETFSSIIGFAEIVLLIGSIIMIIINSKEKSKVTIGYLMGLGAILLEFFVPKLAVIFFILVQCGIYIKAGFMIRNKNMGFNKDYKSIRQQEKDTEWFYGKDDK